MAYYKEDLKGRMNVVPQAVTWARVPAAVRGMSPRAPSHAHALCEVIIKRKFIHGENQANEVTECASGNVIMRASA